MQIETLKVADLIEYKNNAKEHPQEQIDQIVASIKEFGFNDPIAIDENNVIIEGHGRLYALQEMGVQEVDCIRLVHLSEEQKKAYILAHNQLTMNSGWEEDVLLNELLKIQESDIDMALFGFELPEFKINVEDVLQPEQEEVFETDRKYLLHWVDAKLLEPKWELPILLPCQVVPDELMPFNYVLSDKGNSSDKGIHFYIDDYQFERIWQQPELYIEKLMDYSCCLTPDFSLYLDMPRAMKLWNIYRSRMIGQIMQRYGIDVIPTLSWGKSDTFDFCFAGLPKNSVVSVSTVGVLKDEESKKIWFEGMDEAIRQLQPSCVIVYGNPIDYDFGETKVVQIKSNTQERFRNMKEGDEGDS